MIKGDTMLGVALRYGISLEEILAANPDVDPRFLSVDTVLIIPLGESGPIPLATSTPLPVITAEPVCYETTDRGAWCFLLVKNNLDDPLENVSARIYLVPGPRGETVERIAYTPLNLIPPEASLPVMVFFDPPLDRGYMPVAEIISALPANGLDERYVSASLKVTRVDIHPTGLKAVLEGVISIPKSSEPAALISLAAVAYGRDEQVIGVRQAEINGPVDAGVDLPFTMEIFSLGPEIEQVEAFVEARLAGASSDVTPTGD